MLRVLMVLEDYSELVYLQSLLKKLGFDVEAIQNSKAFQNDLLKINPDLIVMNGYGKKVRGVELATHLRRPRTQKVILIAGAASWQDNPDVDEWMESPVVPQKVLETVARVCGLDGAGLAEKFRSMQEKEELERARELKLKPVDGQELERAVDGGGGDFGGLEKSTLSSAERALRYQSFLQKSQAPEAHGFGSKQVAAHVRDLRKDEGDTGDLERERRQFVEHLFAKRK